MLGGPIAGGRAELSVNEGHHSVHGEVLSCVKAG
jgi:hypothetical protein